MTLVGGKLGSRHIGLLEEADKELKKRGKATFEPGMKAVDVLEENEARAMFEEMVQGPDPEVKPESSGFEETS